MSITLPLIALRCFQILFAIIVLALSISLIKGHGTAFDTKDLPASLPYSAFAGAFALVAALIGLASLWVGALKDVIVMGIDALVLVTSFVGGLIIAIKLRHVSCTAQNPINEKKMWNVDLITAGCMKVKGGGTFCNIDPFNAGEFDKAKTRCQMSEADSAFMLLTVVVVLGALVGGWLRMRGK